MNFQKTFMYYDETFLNVHYVAILTQSKYCTNKMTMELHSYYCSVMSMKIVSTSKICQNLRMVSYGGCILKL